MTAMRALMWQHMFAWRLSRTAGTKVTQAQLQQRLDRLPPVPMPAQATGLFLCMAVQNVRAAVTLLEDDAALPTPAAVAAARAALPWPAKALCGGIKPVAGAGRPCGQNCPVRDYFWNAGRSDLTGILCSEHVDRTAAHDVMPWRNALGRIRC
ncbi:hypothetical protein [uncultured Tateyamaria sp.]|uniref:hypothetical protein n=1 Tax=Tateyamaria sp. 1078 TaxID=3417464 RepID=UPI0026355511|nr:hypothetical protein [uncultured Tateyamaria sp.]